MYSLSMLRIKDGRLWYIFLGSCASMSYLIMIEWTYKVIDMISVSCEVFVDQVKWVPSEKDCLVEWFGLSVGSKCFVVKLANIKFNCWLESFFLHPLPAIPCESELVIAHLFQFVHNFSACQISLATVGKNADWLLVLAAEWSLWQLLHIYNYNLLSNN